MSLLALTLSTPGSSITLIPRVLDNRGRWRILLATDAAGRLQFPVLANTTMSVLDAHTDGFHTPMVFDIPGDRGRHIGVLLQLSDPKQPIPSTNPLAACTPTPAHHALARFRDNANVAPLAASAIRAAEEDYRRKSDTYGTFEDWFTGVDLPGKLAVASHDSCTVCLAANGAVCWQLPCGHRSMHKECLLAWKKACGRFLHCPLCREVFRERVRDEDDEDDD
jgi:hypothetical protein